MKMSDRDLETGNDQVETLLRRATPRAVPPIADERAIRDAVHTEWLSVVRERRTAQRWRGLAIAASVVLAATATFSMLRTTTPDLVAVATVDKHTGSVHRRGERTETMELVVDATVYSDQVIETGREGALGLRWGEGGSLRLDENTRVEFTDNASVFLHRGRIYFDSNASDGDARLVINTTHGSVTHLGTQYMTAVEDDLLIVSVREGQVRIDGHYYEETVGKEKQMRFRGSARPVTVDLAGHSRAWAWAESVSPNLQRSDQSVIELLRWAGRETGYKIVFENEAAKRLAISTELSGVNVINAEPRTELRLQMLLTDLDYTFDTDNGTLTVRTAERGPP